jgi:hypothetical protein
MQIDLDQYTWRIIPGRKVCHAVCRRVTESHYHSLCGRNEEYQFSLLLEPFKDTRKCEQCLIAIVGRVMGSYRNEYWREFLRDNPEYRPVTWPKE